MRSRWACVVAGVLVSASAHAATDDPLWRAAVALASANANWVPGRIAVRTETLDEKGQVERVDETWETRRPGPNGDVISEIERATKNGEDVTEKVRKKRAEQDAKTQKEVAKKAAKGDTTAAADDEDEELNVAAGRVQCFVADKQALVSAHRTGETRSIAGHTCVRFDFTQRGAAKEALTHGTAWLDEADGTPREASVTPDPLPQHIKRLVTTVRYDHLESGEWRPSGMTVDGKAAVLFIKRTFRVTVAPSGFWRKAAKAE